MARVKPWWLTLAWQEEEEGNPPDLFGRRNLYRLMEGDENIDDTLSNWLKKKQDSQQKRCSLILSCQNFSFERMEQYLWRLGE